MNQVTNLLDSFSEMTGRFCSWFVALMTLITCVVVVMRYGKIVEQGKTLNILTNPQSNECKSLVMSVPPTNKKIDRFKLISPEGKEISENSTNLTNNIIKNWGARESSNEQLLKFENITIN